MSGLHWVAISHLTSMAPMNVGAGLAAVYILWRRRKLWRAWVQTPTVSTYLALTCAMLGVMALSLVVASIWPLSIDGRTLDVRWGVLLKFWYFLLPLVWGLEWFAISNDEKARIERTYGVTLIVLSTFAILQFWTGWYHPQKIPGLESHFHATAFLGHHLSLATVWPFATLAALSSAQLWQRGGGVLGAVAIFLSYARSVWVAFPVGLAVWGLPRVPRSLRVRVVGVSTLIAAACLTLEPVRQRLFAQYGIVTRMDLWKANWFFFTERPWTGVGFRHNEPLSGIYLQSIYKTDDVFAGHAHNNVLEMLGGSGALGLAVWILWNVALMRLLWRVRGQKWGWAYFCAFLVLHINGLTQVNFWEGKVMHSIMWATGWALAASTTLVDRRRKAAL